MNKPKCEHGIRCYRLNPSHFEDYSHEHLDSIINTQASDGKYQIPLEFQANTEKIMQQLEIMKSLQKKNKRIEKDEIAAPAAKFVKVNDSGSSSGTKSIIPSTSSNNNISDFFKERAAKFKAKNPDEMRAPSSSASFQSPQKSRIVTLSNFKPNGSSQSSQGIGIAEKLRNATPYNFFLTTIAASPRTHSDPLSITFPELLDKSLGELESSVQFCCMADPDWLYAQYAAAGYQYLPLLVIYGEERSEESLNGRHLNVTYKRAKVPGNSGVHHTKMMFFFYKDKSMRVVVSTANLTEFDFNNLVQGLWISERLPPISDGADGLGESETGFRGDLVKYLFTYQIPRLQQIIARVMKADFRSVKVFFVASSPGTHQYEVSSANNSTRGFAYGHPRIGEILSQHSARIDDSSPIIAQTSTLGNYGPYPNVYLLGQISQSFRRDTGTGNRKPDVQVIYPSLNNVQSSHDGISGGGCLVYFSKLHDSQKWFSQHLYQWRSISRNCNQAIPHIKSYCRYSDEGLYWFVLTSANLTRNALGTVNWKTNSIKINNYEAGVLFLPRVMIKKDCFPMNERQQQGEEKIFKLPFDTPLVPYERDDTPYTTDMGGQGGLPCAPS